MSAAFAQSWRAEVLKHAPLIAPARQFLDPVRIAGEEEALERGALQVMVHPAGGGSFLATFALGFRHPTLPTGLHAAPDSDILCALAGGYAYLLNTREPQQCTLLPLRPCTAVETAPAAGLLVFAGFHTLVAWGRDGLCWETGRLSWDGVRITAVTDTAVHGFGWDLRTDREVAFSVDLHTGAHTGGAAPGR